MEPMSRSEREALSRYVDELIDRQFYGTVEIHLQSGHVTHLKETRTIKLQRADTLQHREHRREPNSDRTSD